MPWRHKTLTRYIIEQEHQHDDATGDFSGLLNAVTTAIKSIANQVNRGALVGTLGSAGTANVQGEVQKQLDVIANQIMIHELEWTGHLAGMVSEENDEIIEIASGYRRGKYLLLFDPLDGSSNIDINATVGSIFSVLRAPNAGATPTAADFLQPGTEQVCAGIALYGPATMLVLTTGDGVDGFTLERDIGSFVLTHPDMRIPHETSEFAINASNERFWDPPVQRYVAECLAGQSGPRGRDFNMRWTAALVADAYRILTRGGVFLYPSDSRSDHPGKLRLLYEVNPIAFLVEQAGGLASTCCGRSMEVVPTDIHQRAPLVFGSRDEVERIERYHDEITRTDFNFSLFNTRSLFRR